MNNFNEFVQLFDNPAVSSFNRSKRVDTDIRISQFLPLYWDLLGFGDSAKGESGHRMRLSPLVAPTFSDLRVQEHTAVVPLRVILKNYEQTFNYAKNKETGASLPCLNLYRLARTYLAMGRAGIPIIGSLFDYFGFPVFSDAWKSFIKSINDSSNFTNEEDYNQPIYYIPDSYDAVSDERYDIYTTFNVTFRDVIYNLANSSFGSVYTFIGYIAIQSGFANVLSLYEILSKSTEISIDDLLPHTVFATSTAAMDSYLNYLFSRFINSYCETLNDPDSQQYYTTLPLRAYQRVFYDFLVNGNFVDRDTMLEQNVFDFENRLNVAVENIISAPNTQGVSFINSVKVLKQLVYPSNRLWDDDFFTSQLPTSASDDVVSIPANSSVLDLAKLTALQKLVLKLSYSSRYRDVVWNVFKIKPSDARLQQSSIVKQTTFDVGVGEVLQTSETTVSSVQGTFSGRGYSSGRNKGYHVQAEEPMVLINFLSLVPRSSYKDALHPLIHVDDIFDFPIPDMDVLGNQPIFSDLITGNPADSEIVLGYGRQYEEWLFNYSTVHGNMRTTLDYWQLTRSFDDSVSINDEFLRMSDADDFDRIFSVPTAPHAFMSIFYKAFVTRPVHRNVRIKI